MSGVRLAQKHERNGAICMLRGKGEMALPEGDMFSRAWDSIENGFDGEPAMSEGRGWRSDDLPAWHDLGARLREQLQPVDVASLSRDS